MEIEQNFVIISGQPAKRFRFFSSLLRGVVNRAIYVNVGTFLEEYLILIKVFFQTFRTLRVNFSDFRQKSLGWALNTVFSCPYGYFVKYFSPENCFYYHFWTSTEKFSDFCRNIFDGVVRTAFYVSIGTCWGETFIYEESALHHIWNLRQKFAAILQEMLSRSVRTAFYLSTSFGNHFPFEKCRLILFGSWVKNIWLFVKNYLTGSSKLRCAVSWELL